MAVAQHHDVPGPHRRLDVVVDVAAPLPILAAIVKQSLSFRRAAELAEQAIPKRHLRKATVPTDRDLPIHEAQQSRGIMFDQQRTKAA